MFGKLIKVMKSCRRVRYWSWGGLVSLYPIWGFGEVRVMSRVYVSMWHLGSMGLLV